MPVPTDDLADIRPLADADAQQFWRQHISKEATHATHFMNDDWPARNGVWTDQGEWQVCWESESAELPELIAAHLSWEDNTIVYFCHTSSHVLQTSWRTFKKHWKNFLFYDDEPILIGKKRQQVVRFHSDGTFELGIRPAESK
ncbi:DUF2947 family protein [Thalassolituus sp. LLYu03]|uniref:DUF2947 family protein n=1 Tax=Thalassolituus sp. LLYu03 TaxID=3421656 RepID=UPI003D28FEAF